MSNYLGNLYQKMMKNASVSSSNSTFDSNSDFWNDYNNLNDRYKKQLDPYLHYEYQEGLWDKFGNWLGFNTGADKYRYQMQQQARAVLAGLQQDVFANTYDSQSAQAQRQRDAGLNPDLTGEATGDPASGMEQPLQPVDPSIFTPPLGIIPDIATIFSSAANGLQSVGTFSKLIADITKTKNESVNTELNSWDKALATALDYVSAFDPDLARQALQDNPDVDVTSQDFFNQNIVTARKSGLDQRFSHLSPKAREMMRKAYAVQSKNPLAYDNYYKNAISAQEKRTDYIASKNVHGSLDTLDEVVTKVNRVLLNQREYAMRATAKLNALVQAYNLEHMSNEWDFEVFKREHGLPEAMVEGDLAKYVNMKAQNEAENSINIMQKSFLNYLNTLSKKGDIGSQYILQSIITKLGYAPLMHSSLQGGAFGFGASGTWNNMIVPGVSNGIFPSMSGVDIDESMDSGNDKYYWSDLKM